MSTSPSHNWYPPLPDRVAPSDHELGGPYLFVVDQLLVTSADPAALEAVLREISDRSGGKVNGDPGRKIGDVQLIQLAGVGGDEQFVPRLVTALRSADRPLPVSPNHALSGISHPTHVTVGMPTPAAALPDIDDGAADLPGKGLRVAVLDTGLVKPVPAWFGNSVEMTPADIDADAVNNQELPRYAGHGTAVAGLIRQVAPGARLVVRKVLEKGFTTDLHLAEKLLEVTKAADVNLINLSLGGYSHDAVMGLPATEAVMADLRVRKPDLVIVAGAGNLGVDRQFYPAAYKTVIAVAALNELGSADLRACFSNYGSWVDCATRGVGLVTTFATVEHVDLIAPRPATCMNERDQQDVSFDGWASLSGTSMATPLVTGLILRTMTAKGVGAREAAYLLTEAADVTRIKDLGAILDPQI
jgi:subtilisin family serine protease